MAGLIPDGKSKSPRTPSSGMCRSTRAILDGDDGIDPCVAAAQVYFASSIVTFNWDPCPLRIPSIGTRIRAALDVRFNWRAAGRCRRGRGPGNGEL